MMNQCGYETWIQHDMRTWMRHSKKMGMLYALDTAIRKIIHLYINVLSVA